MRAIYKIPGEAPELRDLANTKAGLRELLGGEIVTSHFCSDACLIVRRDNGSLPYNFDFCGLAVHGPALFVATSGRKFVDMPPASAGFLMGLLEPTEKEFENENS